MIHTIRLLQVALEILKYCTVTHKRPTWRELLDIKHGKFSYAEILNKADNLVNQINDASKRSCLPEEPDQHQTMHILVNMRTSLYNN